MRMRTVTLVLLEGLDGIVIVSSYLHMALHRHSVAVFQAGHALVDFRAAKVGKRSDLRPWWHLVYLIARRLLTQPKPAQAFLL